MAGSKAIGRLWPGFFVVLEGIDGAGKSLQAARLAGALRAGGENVVATREPTDGPFGRRYRAWARGEREASASEVLSLFVEDRREHVACVIAPALAAGRVVICDRYVASTRAYQAAAGVDPAEIDRALAACPAPTPDLALWLRLPVTSALARLGGAALERFEHAELLARVDAVYATLSLTPIDADRPADVVTPALVDTVTRAIAEHRKRA
jgi:dTMP kinase